MNLQEIAEQRLGKDRAEELRSDIGQLAAELEQLRSAPVEVEDEP